MSRLGWGTVPEGQLGWDGHRGSIAIQGPEARPDGWTDPPRPHEIARDVMVVTSWTCPFCKAGNDVWGEGAVVNWMECTSCLKYAWLEPS